MLLLCQAPSLTKEKSQKFTTLSSRRAIAVCSNHPIGADFQNPPGASGRSHDHLFTKLIKAVPTRRIRANDVTHAFFTHLVPNYGPPTWLLSENGKIFAGKVLTHVCELVGTRNRYSTTHYPQAIGQVERYSRMLFNDLRH